MFHSMRSKMILAMLVVTGCAVVLVTAMFYQRSAGMIEEDYVENLYGRLRQMGDALDESLKEIYFLTVQASCDEKILAGTEAYLSEGEEQDLTELAKMLRDYSGRHSEAGCFYLVIPEKRMIVTSLEYPVYHKEISEEKLDEIEKTGTASLTPALIKDPLREQDHILVFVSPVEADNGGICAYVMSCLKERTLYYNYLDNLEGGETSRAALLDENGRIVSAKRLEHVGMYYPAEQEQGDAGTQKDREGQKSGDGRDMIFVQYRADFSGYSFLLEREKNEVLADLREIRSYLAVILLAVLGCVAVLMVVITKAMYQPLKRLTETMGQVSRGGLECRVEVTTKDEIGLLSGEFNDMLDHIEDLIGRLLQEEMLKKDAELEALQYQITPHFMYNTLNSIKYAALLKGEDEIGGLLEDFIELLQASINKKGKFVTVAEEIHFLKNYMNLQRMRYEEEIVVDYQIQQEAYACFLPRLMLQPLVENAILHGLDLRGKRNRIVIGGDVEEGRLKLWVQDYGRGMSQEQIARLLQETHKKEKGLSGIGVANVKERLRLYYGDAGHVTCVSSDAGTKICMYLPAYREQNQYALYGFDMQKEKEQGYDQNGDCG